MKRMTDIEPEKGIPKNGQTPSFEEPPFDQLYEKYVIYQARLREWLRGSSDCPDLHLEEKDAKLFRTRSSVEFRALLEGMSKEERERYLRRFIIGFDAQHEQVRLRGLNANDLSKIIDTIEKQQGFELDSDDQFPRR